MDRGGAKGKRQPRRTNNTTDTEGIEARTEDATSESERRQTCRQISRIPFRITKQTDVEHTVRHQRATHTGPRETKGRGSESTTAILHAEHNTRFRRSAEAAR